MQCRAGSCENCTTSRACISDLFFGVLPRQIDRGRGATYELRDRTTIADELEELGGDEGHRLRLVEPQAAREPLLGEDARLVEGELVDLSGGEVHLVLRSGAAQQRIAQPRPALHDRQIEIALGEGLAVPHGRSDLLDRVRMSAGIVEGVEDSSAPDGVPVRVCFLVVTPEADAGAHLKVLARLARLMRNDALRDALMSATDPDAFAAVLARAEAA